MAKRKQPQGLYDRDLRAEPSWRLEHAELLDPNNSSGNSARVVPAWTPYGSVRSQWSGVLEPIAEDENLTDASKNSRKSSKLFVEFSDFIVRKWKAFHECLSFRFGKNRHFH